MNNLNFQISDDFDIQSIDKTDNFDIQNIDRSNNNIQIIEADNLDIQIIDRIKTIYEENLESFEKNNILKSDNEFFDIEDNLIKLNKNPITYFTKELASDIVYHTLTPIKYSMTSSEGVAYIYNVEGWEEPLAAFKDIQYSISKPGGEYKTKCIYLGVE
ncbi:10479_t:CDS:2, partial [Cetraspora pellucida]